MSSKIIKSVKEWFLAIFWAVLIVISARLFLFDIFIIPTSSMVETLAINDYVLVNKLAYGPRLPYTPLKVPFTNNYFGSSGIKTYSEKISLPYWRLWGYSSIKNNDVIVFNYPKTNNLPIDRKDYFVKRCIAIAGDTIEISNGNVFINNTLVPSPKTAHFDYHIITDGSGEIDRRILEEKQLLVEGGRKMGAENFYLFSLSKSIADSIAQLPFVKHTEKVIRNKGISISNELIFPNHPTDFPWNLDHFGPLYIPQKNDSILLNPQNLKLYQSTIEKFEHQKIELKGDSVLINDKYATHYQFKMNYYFFMGDNRHRSTDSRFWGFVPEDHIVGKASYIVHSLNTGKRFFEKDGVRWNRFLKKIE